MKQHREDRAVVLNPGGISDPVCLWRPKQKRAVKYKEFQSVEDCSSSPGLCQLEGIILFSPGTN